MTEILGKQVSVDDIEIKLESLRLNRLGRGGFSHVYHVFYKEKDAALKQLKENIFKDKHEIEIHEANMMQSFNHINVLSYYGYCSHPVYRGIVMEYCAGGTLSELMNDLNDISYEIETITVIGWLKQIVCGMEHIVKTHYHGDLKPENVMIKERVCICPKSSFDSLIANGTCYYICKKCKKSKIDKVRLKICDFGTSYQLGLKPSYTFSGTLRYAADEVSGGKVKYSEKSDVYSFGVLMFAVVIGTPFEDYEDLQVVVKKLRKEAQLKTDQCRSLTIRQLIRSCTKDLPEERPTFYCLGQKLEMKLSHYKSQNLSGAKIAENERKEVRQYVNIDRPRKRNTTKRIKVASSDTDYYGRVFKKWDEEEEEERLISQGIDVDAGTSMTQECNYIDEMGNIVGDADDEDDGSDAANTEVVEVPPVLPHRPLPKKKKNAFTKSLNMVGTAIGYQLEKLSLRTANAVKNRQVFQHGMS